MLSITALSCIRRNTPAGPVQQSWLPQFLFRDEIVIIAARSFSISGLDYPDFFRIAPI